MDAKKQNRIIVGTAVIMLALVWIGYVIFTLVLDEHYMAAGPTFAMASMMLIAMAVGTWVRVNEAIAYTEQIPLTPVKAPWEEDRYKELQTRAARAIWLLYRACGETRAHLFYQWVNDYVQWHPDNGMSWQEKTFHKYLCLRTPDGDTDSYLFECDRNLWELKLGDVEVNCFKLDFWAWDPDGAKRWVRVYVTEQSGEIYMQMGKTGPREATMSPSTEPQLVEAAILKQYLEGFNVQ